MIIAKTVQVNGTPDRNTIEITINNHTDCALQVTNEFDGDVSFTIAHHNGEFNRNEYFYYLNDLADYLENKLPFPIFNVSHDVIKNQIEREWILS